MTDSELSSSLYLPRRRESSQYDLSNCGLQRAPSTSNIMEKERRIAELERQLSQAHTEQQLAKRELEVYKTSLGSLEQVLPLKYSQMGSGLTLGIKGSVPADFAF
ncbi:unnamed protein product [Cylicostephanus goldi]|uniref:Uncharacterized protein n=1 Tax=Cylicostephanus goldi TaxID=71465 RepID=A0A3P7ND19_CYLGO|nr:unnamed protein product [Cylicostephanus goldi]